ncbi:MAG TPA: 4Fe-4S dicluster domain-containing protein [Anaerolineae bacterium]|nr:4Fe-4S dicluster domain-containing protein [Anaerolineae bacterium]
MNIDRRTFLGIAGMTTASLLLPTGIAVAAPPAASPAKPKGMLVDLSKCIGCGWCQEACKEWNHLSGPTAGLRSGQAPSCLSAENWTLPEFKEIEKDGEQVRVFVKRQCMHCVNPACVSACPVGALQKLETGPVTYDPERCIGCRYCMVACPFGIPKFEWDEQLPRICKCTFCADRQGMGLGPACAAACPAGTLTFGDRIELINEAEARIHKSPDRYVKHIYGKDEIGGTSWTYLSPVPFEELGFPTLEKEPVTRLSNTVAVYGTPSMAVVVGALLGSVYYFFGRQQGKIEVGDAASTLEKDEES